MNTLNAVSGKLNKNRSTWCGPAAISIITGCGYDCAVDLMKSVSGRPMIKGVYNGWMLQALRRLGYDCGTPEEFTDWRPTLAWWLRTRDPEDMQTTYLVNVTHHYVVVRGRKIADNKTTVPVFLRQYPRRRARVIKAWKIVKG
jgi:hypothetical protein